jgi:5-methylcytosine-specific restriction endonuclease McrBC GTP-binding regulatory subunit McrB
MERFAERAAALTQDEFATNLVADMTWWQVIAMVMLELKASKVSGILDHPLMRARIRQASNRNPRAAIWAHLQMHTKKECEEVRYDKRYEPLLFSKDAKSVWSIDDKLATDEVPDLIESLRKYRDFKPGQGVEIKRYDFTTFHQSYSYEDFVEGIKPIMSEEVEETVAYEIKPGIFKTMVQRALADPDHNYALLIDEISRGNVANIFGELITLIEDDKRKGAGNELTARLPYSRDEFVVPKNLYIMGAMNTADRSVESLDTALRRRFTFIALPPRPDLIEQPASLHVDLRKLLTVINARIERLLDKDHCIGHSYFMGIAAAANSLAELRHVFATKILPLMEEYFYGDPAKIGMVLGEAFVSRKSDATDWAKGDWGLDEFEERHVYNLRDALTASEEDFRAVYE